MYVYIYICISHICIYIYIYIDGDSEYAYQMGYERGYEIDIYGGFHSHGDTPISSSLDSDVPLVPAIYVGGWECGNAHTAGETIIRTEQKRCNKKVLGVERLLHVYTCL